MNSVDPLPLHHTIQAMSGGWVSLQTAEGDPYYHNTETDAVQWNKPDALKTEEEKANHHVRFLLLAFFTLQLLFVHLFFPYGFLIYVSFVNHFLL